VELVPEFLAAFQLAISGKTGTAQVFGKNPNGGEKADTSWFASYGPAKNHVCSCDDG
jgi:penicillin-binding protein 2